MIHYIQHSPASEGYFTLKPPCEMLRNERCWPIILDTRSKQGVWYESGLAFGCGWRVYIYMYVQYDQSVRPPPLSPSPSSSSSPVYYTTVVPLPTLKTSETISACTIGPPHPNPDFWSAGDGRLCLTTLLVLKATSCGQQNNRRRRVCIPTLHWHLIALHCIALMMGGRTH